MLQLNAALKERLVQPLPGVPRWVPSIDDEVSVRRLRRVILLALVAGIAAFVVRGADRPPDPSIRTDQQGSSAGPVSLAGPSLSQVGPILLAWEERRPGRLR